MTLDVSRIESILAERQMRKSDLADRSGVSRQSVSTILRRGTCEPKTAGKLAAGLGLPIQSIARVDGRKENQ